MVFPEKLAKVVRWSPPRPEAVTCPARALGERRGPTTSAHGKGELTKTLAEGGSEL